MAQERLFVVAAAFAARSRAARSAARPTGGAFAVAAFEDLLAHILRRRLDFLHLLADACAGGLVSANRLGDILFRLGHKPLQGVVFLHDLNLPGFKWKKGFV
jgi:hypothetical protein